MPQTITLNRYAAAIQDYITKMNQDNENLEYYINLLLATLTGQTISALDVPRGLQQILDRRGIIGIGSYDFNNGSGSPFTVSAGAYWSGALFYLKTSSVNLSMSGLAAGTYYVNLDSAGNPLVSAAADATTTRQFYWDGGHVSSKALYAGVNVLFDGDDYADQLTSAARSKTFTKVADRLEEIETLLGRGVQTLASGNNITINCSLGSHVRITLDRALITIGFSGAYDGQRIVLELAQDATGGRGIAFGAEAVAGGDLTFPVALSTDPSKRDFMGFIYSASTGKYHYTSLARGF